MAVSWLNIYDRGFSYTNDEGGKNVSACPRIRIAARLDSDETLLQISILQRKHVVVNNLQQCNTSY